MEWTGEDILQKRKEFGDRFFSFLVLDIETVIDEDMFQSIADSREKEKKENGEFLPNPYHKVVAFSYLLVKNKKIDSFCAYVSKDEKKVISKFWEVFRKSHQFTIKDKNRIYIKNFPVLITVNGKDFDLPVLKLRTLKYMRYIDDKQRLDTNKKSLSIRRFINMYMDKFDKWEEVFPRYTNRYTPYHIDISVDIFGGRKVSLKKLCYLCNIPVKQEGEGDIVFQLFNENNLTQIARYCAEDVKATAMLFAYINKYLLGDVYKFGSFEQIQKQEPTIEEL